MPFVQLPSDPDQIKLSRHLPKKKAQNLVKQITSGDTTISNKQGAYITFPLTARCRNCSQLYHKQKVAKF